ncbi:NFACT family protein [Desulfallas sp. Bu1-1]|uniref:Rqc2 family fibronectin-binding protein n=1 Tax=Desulfallas sp. Bu1-1 TaxID=2787620 RepID=UPI00189CBFE9|nr:NFACT RNA binding domain-containing protein [Desulfallas sp. Bu1-1]MBF7082300.1 NFACT family protein [Desulfallas sp. Bu1-1]
MPFDGLFLYAVCRELNQKLRQGRIEKIYQPEREEIILVISRPGQKYRLLLSANAENARVHLTGETRANPTTPPVFCMLLRKHLEGAKISEFYQPGLDRILDIRVDGRDELGRPAVKSLICEIMGRHSNIILVSHPDDLILDGIRRYSHAVSRHREVLPGRPYLPPPASNKVNPFSLEEEQFRELILAGNLDDSLAAVMQKALDGLGIPTCREIIKLAGLEQDILLNHCGEHELRTLWQSLQSILAAARESGPRATLVWQPGGEPVDFYPMTVTPGEDLKYIEGGANEIADLFFSQKRAREEFRKQKNLLRGWINKEQKRLGKKLALQRESMAGAQKGDLYRLYGELLTANLYRLERGMREIELVNYHDPEGKTITIPLSPELSGAENAQSYFKKYNKARNTAKAAGQMARLTQEELEYLESVAASLEMAENMQDLEEIKRELVNQGYIKESAPRTGKKREKDAGPQSRPLRYISSDGFAVLVGKNNRQNDTLTLKTAEDHDIWLHACKIPGSHVIIRTEGREVPERTLLEAAALAAYFSRARESGKVPVDYTLRKYVKKPGGAKPGFVIYEKQKTVYVDPRPDAMRAASQDIPK